MTPSFACALSALKRVATIALAAAVLAGCASRPGPDALRVSLEEAPGAREVSMLIATTRARSDVPHEFYSSKRSEKLDFGSATISIPPTHEPGRIAWPSSPPGNPNTDFVVRQASYIDGNAAFQQQIHRELAMRSGKEREAVLFIHGYNTRFSEGVFRLAQMAADAKEKRLPILFTWASAGYLTDYIYDTNSVAIARDGLEKVLIDLTNSSAQRITIVAHSLGNLLLLETLRQMELQGKGLLKNKKVTVVMASPDIDIDVFETMITSLGYRANPVFVLVSRDDRALRFSRRLAGGKARVGDVEDDERLTKLGIVVIDLTEVESQDSINHDKYAQLAQFGPQLVKALEQGKQNRSKQGIGGRLGNAGRSFTEFLGHTAKIVVSTPGSVSTRP
jgi:esterase/lipase superfamily enzyme